MMRWSSFVLVDGASTPTDVNVERPVKGTLSRSTDKGFDRSMYTSNPLTGTTALSYCINHKTFYIESDREAQWAKPKMKRRRRTRRKKRWRKNYRKHSPIVATPSCSFNQSLVSYSKHFKSLSTGYNSRIQLICSNVFFDLEIAGEKAGRVVLNLFDDIVPKVCAFIPIPLLSAQ
jgi:hypothetical protein